ncbi:NB-ARC domain-containing protein [Psidium guajava]|nr:NB-ARC domain-containing protein [Psidium guajava]
MAHRIGAGSQNGFPNLKMLEFNGYNLSEEVERLLEFFQCVFSKWIFSEIGAPKSFQKQLYSNCRRAWTDMMIWWYLL